MHIKLWKCVVLHSHLSVIYSHVNRLCGEHSVDVWQNVVSESSVIIIIIIIIVVVVVAAVVYCRVARHLRRRRSHLLGHVLSAWRQSASQHRTRDRRWPRSHAVNHPDEASHGGARRRSWSRLPAACVQLGAVERRLPAVASRRRSYAAMCCRRTGPRASSFISTTWHQL